MIRPCSSWKLTTCNSRLPRDLSPKREISLGRLLGLEEIRKPEALRSRGGCWFRVGSHQLHIGVEEHFRPANKAHPAFAVDDIEALFAVLEGRGVSCVWDKALEGVRRFHARDPWGHRLELIEPARADGNGSAAWDLRISAPGIRC